MEQFINAPASAFTGMLADLNGDSIRFRDQAFPTGCNPSHGDIGFALNPANDKVRILIQDDVQYSGQTESLQRWASDGTLEFDDVDALLQWLQNDVAPAMVVTASAGGGGTTQSAPQQPAPEITDTQQVTDRIESDTDALYIDEERILEELKTSVMGQDGALHVLAPALSRHIARKEPRRPLTLFAVGPTGVGKTKTGLCVTTVLNELSEDGAHYEFLRLDMCEYREAHRVSQLLGSPQGYVGYGDGAQLTDALARNQRTVVLFDEIEKAHPDILKVLMNAMDAGRLSTPSRGNGASHEVDCRKSIFFFSSNLQTESIDRSLAQRQAYDQAEVVDEVCRAHLKTAGIPPELIGRIGHFLAFRPLNARSKAEIVAVEIRDAAREYGVELGQVDPDVVVDIIQASRAHSFGARTYDYQIHRLLGRVFAEAGKQRVTTPIRIKGPAPYRFEKIEPSDEDTSTAEEPRDQLITPPEIVEPPAQAGTPETEPVPSEAESSSDEEATPATPESSSEGDADRDNKDADTSDEDTKQE